MSILTAEEPEKKGTWGGAREPGPGKTIGRKKGSVSTVGGVCRKFPTLKLEFTVAMLLHCPGRGRRPAGHSSGRSRGAPPSKPSSQGADSLRKFRRQRENKAQAAVQGATGGNSSYRGLDAAAEEVAAEDPGGAGECGRL